MTDYAQVVKDLVAEEPKQVMVEIEGKSFPVYAPDPYEYFKLLNSYNSGELDFTALAVKSIQLCLPGDVSESEAFKILVKAGFFKEGQESGLMAAIQEVAGSVLTAGEAFETGKSPEADANFSVPEASESE